MSNTDTPVKSEKFLPFIRLRHGIITKTCLPALYARNTNNINKTCTLMQIMIFRES